MTYNFTIKAVKRQYISTLYKSLSGRIRQLCMCKTWILRRWADKFCFHCNIFIYIRHIWMQPVLCSHMVSLFHHTSPWTHTCWQSSHNAHRNGRVFRCSVQTACCYWILNRGKVPPIEIHRRMQAVYGDRCVDVSTVRWWVSWNVQWENGLWWSVSWCEYSKTVGKVGKVKSAVRKWFVVISVLMWVQ